MVNQDASQKFVKQGLTFDDVLLILSLIHISEPTRP